MNLLAVTTTTTTLVAGGGSSWLSYFWTAVAGILGGIGGGLVAAFATLRATRETLREQARQLAQSRQDQQQDALDNAVRRAAKQLLTAVSMLKLSEKPSPPFFLLDHAAIDDLLTFSQVPTEVAFAMERAAAALRSYNAAAEWGNAKNPTSGFEAPAHLRWGEARDLVDLTVQRFREWRQDDVPPLHPILDD